MQSVKRLLLYYCIAPLTFQDGHFRERKNFCENIFCSRKDFDPQGKLGVQNRRP